MEFQFWFMSCLLILANILTVSAGLVQKMKFLWIISLFLLLEHVLCENTWEISDNDLVQIEEVKKVSIVAYKKDKMTTVEIEEEKTRIENECHCNVENLPSVGAFILTYEKQSHASIESLNLDPSKEVGVEDQIVTIFNEENPTDPDFNRQWALQDLSNNADINAMEGWSKYMSDVKGGDRDPNGPSVVVAVIDTGIDYNHPDLQDVMWTNPGEIPGNGKDDDGNGIIDDVHGADFNSPSNGDPIDRHSHGTHCAGIIAAKENNGQGIAGVASFSQGKVKIMAIKGLSDRGTGFVSNLLKGLDYAITNGAIISSNSWGGGYMSDSVEQMWDMVLRNNPNHLFVAAAGNSAVHMEGDNNSYKIMTCGLEEPNLLCVGSSTQWNTKSSFSNYGKDYVHLFAPGSSIYSTLPGGRYGTKSGTSMACPHVSGLAALIRTIKPELNAEQVRGIIEASVQKKDVYKNVVSSGGIIDMGKTIQAIQDVDCQNSIGKGKDYTGSMSKTKSGKTCQNWSIQSPQKHSFSSVGDHNQCRNPDGESGVWCYTTDSNTRWELCDVPLCTVDCQNSTGKGKDYSGSMSKTKSGKTCQKWSSQSPQKHLYSSVGEHNQCRNPDGESGVWCYTTDSNTRWELCDVPLCNEVDCQNSIGKGKDYTGSMSKTKSGKNCQKWSSQSPQKHSLSSEGDHNQCRNPDGESGVWCYTTDPNTRWELCDVPLCTVDCQNSIGKGKDYTGSMSKTKSGKPCQKWSSQSPQKHSLSSVGDHNQCRNPDGESGVWCYTTDPNTRWELCDVPLCTG